jgi:SAM-dependent methyltransferase
MTRERPPRNAFGDPLYSPFDVLSDKDLKVVLQPALRRVFDELNIGRRNGEKLREKIWAFDPSTPILAVEAELQAEFASLVAPGLLRDALDVRAQLIGKQIEKFVLGPDVADIGCGDGMVSWYLRKTIDHLFLFDVHNYLDARVQLPFIPYQERAPLPSSLRVDTSLLLTVLHHAKDPLFLLRATTRITRKQVVIIESVFGVPRSQGTFSFLYDLDREQQRKYATFIDWLYNRVLHNGVPVPYNYCTPERWEQVFQKEGWRVSVKVDLGVDQPLVPEHHMLFVLEPGS